MDDEVAAFDASDEGPPQVCDPGRHHFAYSLVNDDFWDAEYVPQRCLECRAVRWVQAEGWTYPMFKIAALLLD